MADVAEHNAKDKRKGEGEQWRGVQFAVNGLPVGRDQTLESAYQRWVL